MKTINPSPALFLEVGGPSEAAGATCPGQAVPRKGDTGRREAKGENKTPSGDTCHQQKGDWFRIRHRSPSYVLIAAAL